MHPANYHIVMLDRSNDYVETTQQTVTLRVLYYQKKSKKFELNLQGK